MSERPPIGVGQRVALTVYGQARHGMVTSLECQFPDHAVVRLERIGQPRSPDRVTIAHPIADLEPGEWVTEWAPTKWVPVT